MTRSAMPRLNRFSPLRPIVALDVGTDPPGVAVSTHYDRFRAEKLAREPDLDEEEIRLQYRDWIDP